MHAQSSRRHPQVPDRNFVVGSRPKRRICSRPRMYSGRWMSYTYPQMAPRSAYGMKIANVYTDESRERTKAKDGQHWLQQQSPTSSSSQIIYPILDSETAGGPRCGLPGSWDSISPEAGFFLFFFSFFFPSFLPLLLFFLLFFLYSILSMPPQPCSGETASRHGIQGRPFIPRRKNRIPQRTGHKPRSNSCSRT